MLIGIIIGIVLLLIDQVSKWIAITNLPYQTYVTVIPNVFRWHYTLNDGMAFGWLGGATWVLIVVTIIGLGIMVFLLKDYHLTNNRLYSIAMILIIAGTLGNFIDRIFRSGHVVDFLNLTIFPWTFNFADMYLTFGVILFAIDTFFVKKG
jgi:signal peptidase II